MLEKKSLLEPSMESIQYKDLYTEEYTEQVRLLRKEVSYFGARILIDNFLDSNGTVDVQPIEIPNTNDLGKRTAYYFQKKFVDYLIDRGELTLKRDEGYVPSKGLLDRAKLSLHEFFGVINSFQKKRIEGLQSIQAVISDVLDGGDGLAQMQEKFGKEKTLKLWEYLMVKVPVKMPCNQILARSLFEKLGSSEKITVFEGGAGVGAVLRNAFSIPNFQDRLANLNQFYFTDIDMSLTKIADQYFKEKGYIDLIDKITYRRADLDDLGDPDVSYSQSDFFDLILLESVLHDVQDLHKTLNDFKRMLKPSGWLVFSAGFRGKPGDFFPCEIMQSTIHSYHRSHLDPPYRHSIGYLSLEEWKASLERVGFNHYRILPEENDHFRWPYGAIIAQYDG